MKRQWERRREEGTEGMENKELRKCGVREMGMETD